DALGGEIRHVHRPPVQSGEKTELVIVEARVKQRAVRAPNAVGGNLAQAELDGVGGLLTERHLRKRRSDRVHSRPVQLKAAAFVTAAEAEIRVQRVGQLFGQSERARPVAFG